MNLTLLTIEIKQEPICEYSLKQTFAGYPIKQTPVLDIFGITSDSHKICLHLHQIYPYLYILVNDISSNFLNTLECVHEFYTLILHTPLEYRKGFECRMCHSSKGSNGNNTA